MVNPGGPGGSGVDFVFANINQVLSPTVLRHLVENVGASQVVIGTDYPFDMGEQRPDLVLESLDWLAPDGTEAIARGNTVRLLGPHATRFLLYESDKS